jgi:hypothetical protein
VEKEWKDLSLIDKGLCALEKGEKCEEKPKPQRLPVKRLQEIIDEVNR